MRKRIRLKRHVSFGSWFASVFFGISSFLIVPSVAAEADINTMLAGKYAGAENWRNFMISSAAGSIHQAEFIFANPQTAASLGEGNGMVMPDGSRMAFRGLNKPKSVSSDEERVTSALKKGRIVTVERMRPPKDFSAGSILNRTSSLLKPSFDENAKTAFLQTKIRGREIEIASAFYKKKPVITNIGVPAILASLVNTNEADILATAYASPEPDYARQSPFDAILTDKAKRGRFIPTISQRDHAWAATPLPATVFSDKEQKCLAEAIYFEAATEPLKGRAAVAQVVLNRVRNPTYPSTICGVVYQNKSWRNRCQFSFACDRIRDRVTSQSYWRTAKQIALAVTAGKIWLPEVGSATHYHATYVRPDWGPTMERVGRIGLHIFYRTYGGKWS